MPRTNTRAGLILWAWVLALAPAMGCRAADLPNLQQEFRASIVQGRRPAELNPKLLDSTVRDGKRIEHVAFDTEAGQRPIAVIVRPEGGAARLPAILVQHWLGGSKDEFLLQTLLWQFATRGYLAAAIDARYQGQRSPPSLQEAAREALRTGKGRPFLVDTVYDDIRTLDYLQSRPDVDPARIGMTGISEGGVETWMTAVADPRVAVAVPVIGVTRFTSILAEVESGQGGEFIHLFHGMLDDYAGSMGEPAINARVVRSAWEKLLPDFQGKYDPVRLVPLIAPRPLLMLNHEKDRIIPLDGAEEVYQACRKRYRELHAEDRVELRVAPGLAHAGQDMLEIQSLLDWFDRWLKPAPAPTAGAARTPS